MESTTKLTSWRDRHKAEQPHCDCVDCRSTIENINGIAFMVRPDESVGWCEDWLALYSLAAERKFGLSTRSYGPETYGHTDVIAGPWPHCAIVGEVVFRLAS